MIMKKAILICSMALFLSLFFVACGGSGDNDSAKTTEPASTEAKTSDGSSAEAGNPSYDIKIGDKLDATMAAQGEKIAELKCQSCHKMTDERLVGPGWHGVTSRHKPEWIMNFMTNTDAMIDKDPKAQAMLEICMVRMPNQSLTDQDAREILEFMRKNDGVK
jgi:cytochrome c551/c552